MSRRMLEAQAWADTTAAGVELPAELAERFANADRLAAQAAELATMTADEPQALTSLLLAGQSPADAQRTIDEQQRAREQLLEQREAVRKAAQLAEDGARKWIIGHRDELIVEALRPAVAALVAEAQPLAARLKRFAPAFDAQLIANAATDDELDAWRAARGLHERFLVCLTAWRSSWKHATSSDGGRQAPGHLRPDAPGGLHAWARPLAVGDDRVRGGRQLELLAVATYADAGGYRLAGPAELEKLTDGMQTERPWMRGDRRPRLVLLPA